MRRSRRESLKEGLIGSLILLLLLTCYQPSPTVSQRSPDQQIRFFTLLLWSLVLYLVQ